MDRHNCDAITRKSYRKGIIVVQLRALNEITEVVLDSKNLEEELERSQMLFLHIAESVQMLQPNRQDCPSLCDDYTISSKLQEMVVHVQKPID